MSQLHAELVDSLLAFAKAEDKDQSIVRDYFADTAAQSEATALAHTVLSSVISFLESRSCLSDLQRRVTKKLLEELEQACDIQSPAKNTTKGVSVTASKQESSCEHAKELQKTYPFAHKVMSSHGWTPNQGLGLDGEGIKEPVLHVHTHVYGSDDKPSLGLPKFEKSEKRDTSALQDNRDDSKEDHASPTTMRPDNVTHSSEEAQKPNSQNKLDTVTDSFGTGTPDHVLNERADTRAQHSASQHEEVPGKATDLSVPKRHSSKSPTIKPKPSSSFYKPRGAAGRKHPTARDAAGRDRGQEQEQQDSQRAQRPELRVNAPEYEPNLHDPHAFTPSAKDHHNEEPDNYKDKWTAAAGGWAGVSW